MLPKFEDSYQSANDIGAPLLPKELCKFIMEGSIMASDRQPNLIATTLQEAGGYSPENDVNKRKIVNVDMSDGSLWRTYCERVLAIKDQVKSQVSGCEQCFTLFLYDFPKPHHLHKKCVQFKSDSHNNQPKLKKCVERESRLEVISNALVRLARKAGVFDDRHGIMRVRTLKIVTPVKVKGIYRFPVGELCCSSDEDVETGPEMMALSMTKQILQSLKDRISTIILDIMEGDVIANSDFVRYSHDLNISILLMKRCEGARELSRLNLFVHFVNALRQMINIALETGNPSLFWWEGTDKRIITGFGRSVIVRKADKNISREREVFMENTLKYYLNDYELDYKTAMAKTMACVHTVKEVVQVDMGGVNDVAEMLLMRMKTFFYSQDNFMRVDEAICSYALRDNQKIRLAKEFRSNQMNTSFMVSALGKVIENQKNLVKRPPEMRSSGAIRIERYRKRLTSQEASVQRRDAACRMKAHRLTMRSSFCLFRQKKNQLRWVCVKLIIWT